MIPLALLLSTMLWQSPAAHNSQCVGCAEGQWSKQAIAGVNEFRIPAPDGQFAIAGSHDEWWVEANHRVVSHKNPLPTWSEFIWAPDSRSIALTQSFGYTSGYSVSVFRITSNGLLEAPGISTLVRKDFETKHSCEDRDVNVAALRWDNNSEDLVLAAQEPPVGGVCPDMYYFETYLVSVTDRQIRRHVLPPQLPDEWKGSLGDELAANYKYIMKEEHKKKLKSKRERSFVLSLQSRRESTL